MTVEPVRGPRLAPLAGLRFVAAALVVVFHYGQGLLAEAPTPLRNVAAAGYVGVSLFFVLSGFVLAYVYLDNGRLDRRRFLVARFARIYPLYLFAVTVAAPLYLHALFSTFPPELARSAATANVLSTLTMLRAWSPFTAMPLHFNIPAWSLCVEATFYLLFPAIAGRLAGLSGRQLRLAVVALWPLALLAPSAYLVLDPDHLATTAPGSGGAAVWLLVLKFNPLLHLPEFLIGVVLGRLFLEERACEARGDRGAPATGSAGRRWRDGGWLAAASGIGLLAALAASPALPYPLLHNGLLAPLFGLLIYGLARGGGWLGRLLALPPLVLLGEASYGVYVLQEPLFNWLRVALGALLGPEHLFERDPAFLGLYAVALLALSLLTLRLVEQPTRAALKRSLAWYSDEARRSRPPQPVPSPVSNDGTGRRSAVPGSTRRAA